ncbi:MAG: response regulator [Deltaproteobacteria bacterium]
MEHRDGRKSILIVDDEAPFRFSACVALRRAGYRVEEAADGRRALDAVLESRRRGDPFDLVVTDIRMPEMSGIELIDALRERGVDVPLCAITCFGDRDLVADLARRGCTGILEKPFDPADLVAWVGGRTGKGAGGEG